MSCSIKKLNLIEHFNSILLSDNLNPFKRLLPFSDRAPNLGGLARTSEIFGIKRLIIGNNHILKDREFLSLSVTAHRWLEIEEVFAWNLIAYLRDLKRSHNYTLIGIEQSTESVCLTKFEFPVRSIVVLGNEKEGLPVELLQVGTMFRSITATLSNSNLACCIPNLYTKSDLGFSFHTDDGLLRRNTASWNHQIAQCTRVRRPDRLLVLQATQFEFAEWQLSLLFGDVPLHKASKFVPS